MEQPAALAISCGHKRQVSEHWSTASTLGQGDACSNLASPVLTAVLIECRVENEDREPDQRLLAILEGYARTAVGTNWGAAVDAELVASLGKYRRYEYTCLRDLLRVIRNKRNHFREMPDSLQQLMGPIPDGFYR